MTPTKIVDPLYPESDGLPMADNTLQWDWMVRIVEELKQLFAGKEVFVAGNLFWYPVKGARRLVAAPDAMVVFGRPPGYRGSYKQWLEGDVAPQVVFEIFSPSNTPEELEARHAFYQNFGVEEYYFIDPYENLVEGYLRDDALLLSRVWKMDGFVSPRLGIRFEVKDGVLAIHGPDGHAFRDRGEQIAELAAEAKEERLNAARALQKADQEQQRAEEQKQRAEKLAAKLKELGIDPDAE